MHTVIVESQQRPKKILVVDDSPTELLLMVRPLLTNRFEVITAVDAEEAEEKVVQERPDCVVLDVVMPKGNGFQLCRRIKQYREICHIPVILLTRKNTALDRSWGLRQGADAYLTKPFIPEELLSWVRQLVS